MRRSRWPRWANALLTVAVLSLAVALALHAEAVAGFLTRAESWWWHVSGGAPAQEAPVETSPAMQGLSYTEWDESESPEYWRVVGKAVVDTEMPAGTASYAPLDELGRAVGVSAHVTIDMMMEGIERDREELRDVRPSGWGRNGWVIIEQPDGKVYEGYFWNRSHLLAKSLGGAETSENLVMATHMQNVGSNDRKGGMAYPETLARGWLATHSKGTLYYRATPVYEGDEPVCRSVLVDLLSSDGELDLEIEVYNAAKGYVIDYATGEFWAAA